MTLVGSRVEALVVARARTIGRATSFADLVAPLARFAPSELTPAAWRERLAEVVDELKRQDVLDAGHRLRDADELGRRFGKTTARSWRELADRVLPGVGLGIAPEDGKLRARLAGREAWAAAIVGRRLGLWVDGPPPSLTAMCDALVWRELGLGGKPKRLPPEVRAHFIQRVLHSEPGPAERLVRVLAAREVGAPRPELRALCDALVRGWLVGRTIDATHPGEPDAVPVASSPAAAPAVEAAPEKAPPEEAALEGSPGKATPEESAPDESAPEEIEDRAPEESEPDEAPLAEAMPATEAEPPSFAGDVMAAVAATTEGWFSERKVFISAVWRELRRNPRWSELSLDELKRRLVDAHRTGELVLARADLVAAMDPELVAASEITTDGATFHFLVREPAT
ncbi:MAG TPA: hypothetical protein VFK02_27115 [Kofleriaceae bacterium]|nr:hypothetical protein [Kofleriaceae bacterium]